MPDGEINIDVVHRDVKALAEGAGSYQKAKVWQLVNSSQYGTNSRKKSRVVSVMVSGP